LSMASLRKNGLPCFISLQANIELGWGAVKFQWKNIFAKISSGLQ